MAGVARDIWAKDGERVAQRADAMDALTAAPVAR